MSYAKLRICASCEWIFKQKGDNPECPKCSFGSYSARYVYGNKAYRYAKSQKPWFDKKMHKYAYVLQRTIRENTTITDKGIKL